jgi:hypothetical protein
MDNFNQNVDSNMKNAKGTYLNPYLKLIKYQWITYFRLSAIENKKWNHVQQKVFKMYYNV